MSDLNVVNSQTGKHVVVVESLSSIPADVSPAHIAELDYADPTDREDWKLVHYVIESQIKTKERVMIYFLATNFYIFLQSSGPETQIKTWNIPQVCSFFQQHKLDFTFCQNIILKSNIVCCILNDESIYFYSNVH